MQVLCFTSFDYFNLMSINWRLSDITSKQRQPTEGIKQAVVMSNLWAANVEAFMFTDTVSKKISVQAQLNFSI